MITVGAAIGNYPSLLKFTCLRNPGYPEKRPSALRLEWRCPFRDRNPCNQSSYVRTIRMIRSLPLYRSEAEGAGRGGAEAGVSAGADSASYPALRSTPTCGFYTTPVGRKDFTGSVRHCRNEEAGDRSQLPAIELARSSSSRVGQRFFR
jgi:hypothetical protein